MLGALAGAEALEIVVSLKDLSEAGLKRLESNIKNAEKTANGTNFSGFSSKTKGLASDAEHASGKGGIGGLISGFLGIPGPVAAATIAIGGLTAITAAVIPTFENVEKQERALTIAAKGHGIAVDDMNAFVEKAITTGEEWAYTASDTRQAITKLTEAGISLADQQNSLPVIMDLARAKNIDLAEATDAYTSSLFGNARALKQYGIILPQVSTSAADVGKAQDAVTKAQEASKHATEQLAVVEDGLKGKHKLTAAEALRLKSAQDRVTSANASLKKAQEALTLAQNGGVDTADRLRMVNDGLTKAVGGQKGSIDELDKKQATLNDKWEKFATKIGPALEAALGRIVDTLSTLVDILGQALDTLSKIGSHPESGNILGAKPSSGGGPKSPTNTGYGKHAEGGWVGLNGPELSMVGERGPEFITRSGNLPGGTGATVTVHSHLYLDGRQVAEVIERHLGSALALRGTGAMSFGGI